MEVSPQEEDFRNSENTIYLILPVNFAYLLKTMLRCIKDIRDIQMSQYQEISTIRSCYYNFFIIFYENCS